MSKIKLTATILLSTLILMACSTSPNDPTTMQTNLFGFDNYLISPQPLADLLGQESFTAGLQILDVRTPAEFAVSCLKNSQLIDWQSVDFDQKIAGLDKNDKYLVYCRSGRRSADAVNRLRSVGINNIVELKGGINAWQSAGLSVENNCS